MLLIRRLQNAKNKYDPRIDRCISSALTRWQRFWIYVDIKIEKKIYGSSTDNYFEYEYYWRNRKGRDAFANFRKTKYIYDTCNPISERHLTGNKSEFNTKFSDLLNRKWLNVSESSYEDFSRFITETDTAFAKPIDGECGFGTRIVRKEEIDDLGAFYKQLKDNRILLEEVIVQNEAFRKLNSSSVNTLRVVTLRDIRDEVHVMAGVLRIGRKDAIVDNYHNGGMIAVIDVQTGIVYSTAVDYENRRYIVHPNSGEQIVGFKVPYWDRVIETAKKAALRMKTLRYIGWDIVVGEQGKIYVVEANSTPDTDLTQAPDQIGKWEQYRNLVEEIKNFNN